MTWTSILGAPAHGQHVAQLYTEADFLVRAVGQFVVAGLHQGEAILLVATAAHRPAILRHLADEGFVLDDLSRRGQLTVLDAAQTLAELLIGGLPERSRFQSVIGGAVEAGKIAGFTRFVPPCARAIPTRPRHFLNPSAEQGACHWNPVAPPSSAGGNHARNGKESIEVQRHPVVRTPSCRASSAC